MAAGDPLTLPSDVKFTPEEFGIYLGVDNAWGAMEECNRIYPPDQDDPDPWYHVKRGELPLTCKSNPKQSEHLKSVQYHITTAFTALKVALLMCDDLSQYRCRMYIYSACKRSISGTWNPEDSPFVVLKAVEMFANNKPIIADILGSLPVTYIVHMISYSIGTPEKKGEGPLFDPELYRKLQNPPHFENGILLGLNPEALLISSIKNYIAMDDYRLDNFYLLERLCVKYIDGDSDLVNHPEDVRMLIRLKELMPNSLGCLGAWLAWDDLEFMYCNTMRDMLLFRTVLGYKISLSKFLTFDLQDDVELDRLIRPREVPKYNLLSMVTFHGVLVRNEINTLEATKLWAIARIERKLGQKGIIL